MGLRDVSEFFIQSKKYKMEQGRKITQCDLSSPVSASYLSLHLHHLLSSHGSHPQQQFPCSAHSCFSCSERVPVARLSVLGLVSLLLRGQLVVKLFWCLEEYQDLDVVASSVFRWCRRGWWEHYSKRFLFSLTE